jgi:cyclopropane-fatty-acyl-phospholipid synthase
MSILDTPVAAGFGAGEPIDPIRWPGLTRVPRVPLRGRLARGVFERAVRRLPLAVVGESGRRIGGGGGTDAPVMRVSRPCEFFQRLGADGLIGFGESYQTGAWDAGGGRPLAEETPGDELVRVLSAFASHVTELVPKPLQRLRRAFDHRFPAMQDGDQQGARRNIEAHYDLSNDMFASFLDPSMTYSSALFEPGETDLARLEEAQERKVDAILDAAKVGEGTRLLEIGTGWGTLAIRAARRGARVVSLTLSRQQRELALRRIDKAGLADSVEVLLADYREVEGSYDAIVSVEMIEAVGERYLPDYFAAIDRLLAPGGRVGIQAITMPDERMRATRRSYTWIHKYIFPGGMIPSVEAIQRTLAAHTSLRLIRRYDFGDSYASTLRAWRQRFERNWQSIRELGFDEVFHRTWRFYLAYCEAGFATDYIGVAQLTLTR